MSSTSPSSPQDRSGRPSASGSEGSEGSGASAGSGGEGSRGDVTQLLERAVSKAPGATDRLLAAVYDELRGMARGLMARESGNRTLQPTALVHEAYLRLLGPGPTPWQNRAHFFGAAALAMRRILIDRARASRSRQGPGGPNAPLPEDAGEIIAVPSSGLRGGAEPTSADDLIALDTAMESLAKRDARQHEVVMLRYFAGLTIEDTAEVLGVSPATVKTDWAYARAWLMREMKKSSS